MIQLKHEKEVLHVTVASEYDSVEDKLAKEVLLVTLAAEDDAFEEKLESSYFMLLLLLKMIQLKKTSFELNEVTHHLRRKRKFCRSIIFGRSIIFLKEYFVI